MFRDTVAFLAIPFELSQSLVNEGRAPWHRHFGRADVEHLASDLNLLAVFNGPGESDYSVVIMTSFRRMDLPSR